MVFPVSPRLYFRCSRLESVAGGSIASMLNMLDKPKESLANLENLLILSPIGAPNRRHEHGAGTPFAKKLLTGLRGGVSHAALH